MPGLPGGKILLAKKSGQDEPNPEGQIMVSKPAAFLGFFRKKGPVKKIRKPLVPKPKKRSSSPPPPPPAVPQPASKEASPRDPEGLKDEPTKLRQRPKLKRRGWYCELMGLRKRSSRQENFLNMTPEEIEAVKRKEERAKQKKDAEFERMYKSYAKGIIGKVGIMKEMNELCSVYDYKRLLKFTMLYEDWRTQVYEHIQRQVEHALEGMSPDYIKDKLRWFHYQYMDISNQENILLDVLRPNYDPFESLKHVIKYSMKGVYDPVKHDLHKENLERRFMGDPTLSDVPVFKEMLHLKHWPAYHFRGSMWGHITADEEDGSEIIKKNLDKFISKDVLYHKLFEGGEYVKAEFPKGRYMVPGQGRAAESLIDKPQGIGMVWDVECQRQPKLKLWYN